MIWLAIAVGGALGTMARHGVAHVLNVWIGRSAPYATASVNLIGSLVIGLLAGLLAGGHLHESSTMRAFVFVGVLGGFTTFSTFILDTFTLAEGGHTGAAALNVICQVVVGYALAYVGFKVVAS